MKCSSTRNRRTNDRCSLKALKGILFCGKHARSKKKTLWKPETLQSDSATKIQKIWRGYMIRNFLFLAGHSADLHGKTLCRLQCHNEEELVTLESKEKQHPMNFFCVYQSGKLWWFGLDTIFKLMQEDTPKNPYTNEPFSRWTRQHVRELQDIATFRKLCKIPETLHHKAVALAHVIEDETFEEISYTRFEHMSRLSIIEFTAHIHRQLEERVFRSPTTIRRKHLFLIESCIVKQFNLDVHTDFLRFQLISSLLYILRTLKNKFRVAFIIFGGFQYI